MEDSVPLRILIADDHQLFRQGLRFVLQALPRKGLILEAKNGYEVLDIISREPKLDLILLDLFMPGVDGFKLMENLCDRYPKTPFIILSSSDNSAHMRKAINSGASGFIPKTASQNVIMSAVELVLAGGIYIPPEMVHIPTLSETGTSVISNRKKSLAPMLSAVLTERQLEVLKLLGEGRSNKEIARLLDISENTVKIHIAAILRTLNVKNRTQAGIIAQKLMPGSMMGSTGEKT